MTQAQQTMNTQDPDEFIKDYEQKDPVFLIKVEDREMFFATPNMMVKWRMDTFFTKEPLTLQWINNFSKDEVFLDIGANIGVFSIYAAFIKGSRVFAFEPEAMNFALLNKNIVINQLGERMIAYPMAIMDSIKVDKLHLSVFNPGASLTSFGDCVDQNLHDKQAAHVQGCVSWTMDGLIKDGIMPCPKYIKIDVDGFEHKVIAGAVETLASGEVESVLIELNPDVPQHHKILLDMEAFGYTHNDVPLSEQPENKKVCNYIFYKSA